MRYLEVGTRALLAVVFVAALVGKVSGRAGYRTFLRSLQQMDVVPVAVLRPVAATTVVAEAGVVLLLLVPTRWTGFLGFTLAGILFAVFTAVVARSVRRERGASCHCFGASDTPLGRRHVVRNIALMVAAAVGLIASASSGELRWAAASFSIDRTERNARSRPRR